MNSKSKKIAFLFGSGVSIPAGMPSTSQITERVLSGENIYRHTAGVYLFTPSVNDYQKLYVQQYVHRVIKFLNRIKKEVDEFYNSKRFKLAWNYEDYYYIARQIYDNELGEFENPGLQPFVDRIMTDIQPLLIGKPSETREQWELHELASETRMYIEDVLSMMLNKKPKETDNLSLLHECYLDTTISSINIFTLNHDIVIDTFFSDREIKYMDGFGDDYPNIRNWNPKLLENPEYKIKLIKLHGGINWRRIIYEKLGRYGDLTGIPNFDSDNTRDEKGNLLYRIYERPIILVGTYNKMLDYVGGIFDDLFYYFYKGLRETDTLIVSGYSFGDRGINTKIIDWIYLSYDHKIIVIHPDPDDLLNRSRGSIGNKWEDWIEQNKLFLIPKPIEKTNWEDIKILL